MTSPIFGYFGDEFKEGIGIDDQAVDLIGREIFGMNFRASNLGRRNERSRFFQERMFADIFFDLKIPRIGNYFFGDDTALDEQVAELGARFEFALIAQRVFEILFGDEIASCRILPRREDSLVSSQ